MDIKKFLKEHGRQLVAYVACFVAGAAFAAIAIGAASTAAV